MQTENDTITATLRLKDRSKYGVTIFKDREKAVAHENVAGEQVGYMAVGKGETTRISSVVQPNTINKVWYTLSGQKLVGKPKQPGTYIAWQDGRFTKIFIR